MSESNPVLPLIEELATIKNYLIAAQDILKSGYMPDISGLDKRVGEICEKIMKAPKEAHEQYLPELVKIVEQLNDCEKDMRAFYEAQQKGMP